MNTSRDLLLRADEIRDELADLHDPRVTGTDPDREIRESLIVELAAIERRVGRPFDIFDYRPGGAAKATLDRRPIVCRPRAARAHRALRRKSTTAGDDDGEPPPLAYAVPEAARLASLSPRTIWRAIERADLPARRVGRRVVVLRADLERFLVESPTVSR